ncbi:MAG TPA: GNAT family N-acetyltransferase [Planctomycetaceae bacterium]
MKTRPSSHSEIVDLFRKDNPDGELPLIFGPMWLGKCDGFHAVEVDGRTAGGVAFNSTRCGDDGDGETQSTLELIYVAKAHREKGIAPHLCEFAIRHLIARDRTPIFCAVTSKKAHGVIDRVPVELRSHLRCEFSYLEYGDEWADRGW